MDNDDRHGEPPPSDNDSNVDDYYDDVEDDGGGGDEDDEDEDDDDEDDRDGKVFIPYEQRPEWDDITPCQPDPLEPDVLSILFTPQFRNVHGYFRAVFKNNELSLRSLKVTEECISYNPANSTTWSFRRKILLHLKCDLREELDYISSVIKSSPKNYQVWQHRKWIVQQLNQPDFEKSFTSQLFGMDSKNYHAWQHRQWVISHFNLWNGELEFSEQLIDNDVLNNSAWNHRYFVVKGLDKFDDEKFISTEVTFVLQKIKKMSSNESPWNYLRGILKKIGLNKFPQLVQTLNFYVDESLHSLAFQIDAIEETLACQDNPDQALLNKAIGIADKLKNQVDPIRSTYWEFVSRSLIAKYSSKT